MWQKDQSKALISEFIGQMVQIIGTESDFTWIKLAIFRFDLRFVLNTKSYKGFKYGAIHGLLLLNI